MCIFTKLLIGGLVVISPAIIALGVGVVAAVFLPLAAVGGVTGNEVYNGRGLVIQMWKLFKKLKREFF
jgi:hypothetical protein